MINSVGNGLSPFDSFLLLRGVKTLAVRMDRQQSSAMVVAQLLSRLGFATHYPGLPNHPDREIHERIADGYGAVLSFETGDKELSERIVGATRLWGISVSFGCVNSLISMPCVMSYVFGFDVHHTHRTYTPFADTHPLTLPLVLLAAYQRISFVFALVSKIRRILLTTYNTPSSMLVPSRSLQTTTYDFPTRSAALSRSLLSTSRTPTRLALVSTGSGSSAPRARSSSLASTQSCTVSYVILCPLS